ncbi:MAG: ABC transporter substrate-binding protein [Oscillospiraceae bacterium]|nr:ABC transporter substrate-binding protein [Oscillospiraceae bacterium]
MKKTFIVLLAIAMLIACLCGCGSASTSANQTAPSQSGTATASEPEETKTSIKIGIIQDPGSLAPYNAIIDAQHSTALIYDKLFMLDGENMLQPCLAESYTIEDGNNIVIKIRDGVKDSAGNPFTASDAVFTLRLAEENGMFFTVAIDAGACEVLDDNSFRMKLHHPDSGLLARLAFVPMVTEKSYQDSPDQMVTTPVGTGPYKLVEWVSGSSMTLTYNENYWGKEPQIKDVTIVYIVDDSQRTTALETGAVDLVYSLPTSDVEHIKNSGIADVASFESVKSSGVIFNANAPSICANLKLRQAISHAINYEAIAAVAYNGYAQTAKELFSPLCSDYTSSFSPAEYFKYDLDLAKELMAESGVPEGTELQLITWPDPGLQQMSVQIQDMLSQIGLKVNITSYENAMFNQIIFDPTKYDIIATVYFPPSGASTDLLDFIMLYCQMDDNMKAKYQDYYSREISELDLPTLQGIVGEMLEEMYVDTPYVTACHLTQQFGYNSGLSGVVLNDAEMLDMSSIAWK